MILFKCVFTILQDLKRILKYLLRLYRKFDISPMGRYSFVKLIIFLSWIFNVLSYTSSDCAPDLFPLQKFESKIYCSCFTEKLSAVELPIINDIKFLRSEIGTISSFNVLILPLEPFSVERDRAPPFHIFSA